MNTQDLRLSNYVTIDNQDSWRNLKNMPLIVTGINNHIDSLDLELFPDSDGTVNLKSEYETYSQFSQFVKPILLNEAWLLLFGYIHNKEWDIFHLSEYSIDNISHQKNSRLVFRFINGKIQCLQFYLDSMSNPQWQPRLIFIQEIKYVHQIQNIFHELTNEELTIK